MLEVGTTSKIKYAYIDNNGKTLILSRKRLNRYCLRLENCDVTRTSEDVYEVSGEYHVKNFFWEATNDPKLVSQFRDPKIRKRWWFFGKKEKYLLHWHEEKAAGIRKIEVRPTFIENIE